MIYHQKKDLTLGDNSEELLSEASGGLPFMCMFDEGRLFTGQHIPWHWHDQIELNYVETGSFRIHTPDEELEVQQGDALFINRNVMHSYDLSESVNYYAYTFDTQFLSGEFGGYLDRKYFSPVFHSRSLSVVHLRPDTVRRVRMIDCLLQSIDAVREEPAGYELMIRKSMSRFFLMLLEEKKEALTGETTGDKRDLDRMKVMLQYIYAHYSEPVTLDDIAATAGISTRECARCFRRAINRPPVRFLIEYRAQMAAMMLIRTDNSISSIAEQCGFVSDSYFGKIFKEIYNCTPRDYRKTHISETEKK